MVFPWEQIVCFRVKRQAEEKKAMAAAAKSMGKKKSFGPADFRKCQQLSRFNELVEREKRLESTANGDLPIKKREITMKHRGKL